MTIDNDAVMALIGDDFAAYVSARHTGRVKIQPRRPHRVRAERDSILVRVVDPIASNALRWADMTS